MTEDLQRKLGQRFEKKDAAPQDRGGSAPPSHGQHGIRGANAVPAAPLAKAPEPSATAVSAIAERESRKQRILLELEQLPSLPSVVIEVMKLIQDPNSTAKDFDAHVRKDQVLTAKMLKLVNSSFYSLSRKITTISEAVVILGFNTLKSLVLAASTRRFLERPLSGYGYEPRGLWKHSISCAGGSKFLARELGLGDQLAEELFVAGLLHDIGKLILGPMIEERLADFRRRLHSDGATLLDAERATTEFDHPAVANLILKKWKLPEELADAIVHHHQPENAAVHPRRAAILHIVSYVANRLHLGLSEAYSGPPPLSPFAYQALAIEPERFRDVLARIETAMHEIEALFREID